MEKPGEKASTTQHPSVRSALVGAIGSLELGQEAMPHCLFSSFRIIAMNSWKSMTPSLFVSFDSRIAFKPSPATCCTDSSPKISLSSACEILPSPFLSNTRKADQHTSSCMYVFLSKQAAMNSV